MTSLRKLGSSDLDVFPLSLGGNVFGWTADQAQSFAVLDAYTAAGGNFVDTADTYSAWAPGNEGGESETVLGDWLAARGNRADVVVATKVGAHPRYKGLSGANIKAAADASLRRLKTDYIDLYYTHFDDPSVPVEEIITALDELVRAGKVRAIAASNLSPERLQESLDLSDREGLARYVALQPRYNLVSRDSYEGPLRDVASRAGLAVVPYSSLASGFLTGKYRAGAVVDSARAGSAGRIWRRSGGRGCWPRSTRSRASAGSRSPPWLWPGWPPGRLSSRPSPALVRWSSFRRCWGWPGSSSRRGSWGG